MIYVNKQNNIVTVTFPTDGSATYDTADVLVFLRKLEHYSIQSDELKLMQSYLTNRKCYVELYNA